MDVVVSVHPGQSAVREGVHERLNPLFTTRLGSADGEHEGGHVDEPGGLVGPVLPQVTENPHVI